MTEEPRISGKTALAFYAKHLWPALKGLPWLGGLLSGSWGFVVGFMVLAGFVNEVTDIFETLKPYGWYVIGGLYVTSFLGVVFNTHSDALHDIEEDGRKKSAPPQADKTRLLELADLIYNVIIDPTDGSPRLVDNLLRGAERGAKAGEYFAEAFELGALHQPDRLREIIELALDDKIDRRRGEDDKDPKHIAFLRATLFLREQYMNDESEAITPLALVAVAFSGDTSTRLMGAHVRESQEPRHSRVYWGIVKATPH